MLDFCAKHSVVVLDAASLPFSEQVALFQRKCIISGVHGAGLTNQLWMRNGGSVIDVSSTRYINPPFGELAHSLGHGYKMIAQTYMEHAGMTCDPRKNFGATQQLIWAFENAKKTMYSRAGDLVL